MTDVRVRVVRSWQESAALHADWTRLFEAEGGGVTGFDVSASFEWTQTLWQHFLAQESVYLLVAERDGSVCGLLPCALSWQRTAGIRHRHLSLASALVYELRTGFLVAGDGEVLAALIDAARRELPSWDSFSFTVIQGSRSDQAQQRALQALGLKPRLQGSWSSSYIAVHPEPDKVLSDLKANMRTKMRKRERELNAMGRYEFRLYETAEQIPDFLNLMLAVEAQSWKREAGTAMTENSRQHQLYQHMTPVLVGQQRFLGAALWLDDVPLAFQYGFLSDGVYVGEKTSFDNRYRDYGAGTAMTAKLLDVFSRRGIHTFDLGGVTDSNKAQWTDKTYTRYRWRVIRSTWRGLLIRAAMRLKAVAQRLRSRRATGESDFSPAAQATA